MNSLYDHLSTPESVTNTPRQNAAYREALEHANREAGEDRHGWRHLSTNTRAFLLGLLAFVLVFTGGYVLGVKSTNDYFQEIHR